MADRAIEEIASEAGAFRGRLAPRPEKREEADEPPLTCEYNAPPAVRAAEEAVIRSAGANAAPRAEQEGSRRNERRELRFSMSSKLALLQRLADECAAELPREFFRELSGGISLTDRTKKHPQSEPGRPLLVLGEYRNDRNLGRSIMLYGGSILRTYGHLPEEELKKELRRIIRHEFTHHIESLCGERGLEIEDEIRLAEYKSGTPDAK